MAAISVTYSYTNGTTLDADQINQNFTDIINGTSDGTKDFSVNALNGNVTLGNSSGDDLTVTASLASSIPIKTTRTYNIGSADLGLATVYYGGNSTHTIAVSAPSSGLSGDVTYTLPPSNGTSGYLLTTDGSGVTTWKKTDSIDSRINYSLATSVTSSALTIALKDGDGNDPSATSPAKIAFRSSTLTTGTYSTLSRTSALSITIPSTATMGWTNGDTRYVYVYALNNSGTWDDLVVASQMLDENALHTTTTIDTGADSLTAKYSNTSRTSMPVKYLGKILVAITTAGTWVTPSEASIGGLPRAATAMDNAEATRLGLKMYVAGTSYNNSASPTLSGSNSWSTVRGVFRPFQTQDGTWFLWMQVQGTVSSGSRTSSTVDINGITTKNTAGYNQALACTSGGSATDSPSAEMGENDNTVVFRHATDTTTRYSFEGTIELESKPTWAYG
jgi:hypothetical protein